MFKKVFRKKKIERFICYYVSQSQIDMLGMRCETFVCLITVVCLQIVLLLIWALTWREMHE